MVSEFVMKANRKVTLMFKSLLKLGQIPYAVFVKILDRQILPYVLYGCEIWGLKEVPEIVRVHVFALKRYLNVGSQTPNTMVYGETGRYPLFVATAIKAVEYWLRVVMMSPERHTRKAYNMLVSMDSTGKETWATWVPTFLCSPGFGHVWLYYGTGDTGRFISSLKENLIQLSVRNWQSNLHCSNIYDVYKSFKSVIMSKAYLGVLEQRYVRNVHYRLRLGISDLCHKTNTMRILCAQCVKQNLKMKSIFCSSVQHTQASDKNTFPLMIGQPVYKNTLKSSCPIKSRSHSIFN